MSLPAQYKYRRNDGDMQQAILRYIFKRSASEGKTQSLAYQVSENCLGQDRCAQRQGALVKVQARVMEIALVAFDARPKHEHRARSDLREGAEILGAQFLGDRGDMFFS